MTLAVPDVHAAVAVFTTRFAEWTGPLPCAGLVSS